MAFHGIPFRVCSSIVGNERDSAISKIHEERFAKYKMYKFHIPIPMPMTKIGRMLVCPLKKKKKKLQSIFPSSKKNPPAFSPLGRFPQPSPGQVGRRPAPPGAAGAGAGVAGAAFTVAEAREAPGNQSPLVI